MRDCATTLAYTTGASRAQRDGNKLRCARVNGVRCARVNKSASAAASLSWRRRPWRPPASA
jgi:hypothetical protein